MLFSGPCSRENEDPDRGLLVRGPLPSGHFPAMFVCPACGARLTAVLPDDTPTTVRCECSKEFVVKLPPARKTKRRYQAPRQSNLNDASSSEETDSCAPGRRGPQNGRIPPVSVQVPRSQARVGQIVPVVSHLARLARAVRRLSRLVCVGDGQVHRALQGRGGAGVCVWRGEGGGRGAGGGRAAHSGSHARAQPRAAARPPCDASHTPPLSALSPPSP